MTAEEEAAKCQIRRWPHSFSFAFAVLSCTLGMFGINRFAVLTVDFGAVFLVQFLLLSLFLGIPMMAFYVCLGQYLGSGVVDMWRISPIFQVISKLCPHPIVVYYVTKSVLHIRALAYRSS